MRAGVTVWIAFLHWRHGFDFTWNTTSTNKKLISGTSYTFSHKHTCLINKVSIWSIFDVSHKTHWLLLKWLEWSYNKFLFEPFSILHKTNQIMLQKHYTILLLYKINHDTFLITKECLLHKWFCVTRTL